MIKKLAITNCGVSSDEQLKNNSPNRQRESVLEAAKRLDVTIPEDGQWSGSVSSKKEIILSVRIFLKCLTTARNIGR